MEGRILILDDEESILEVVTECFVQEDFSVRTIFVVKDVVDEVNKFMLMW